MDKQLANLIETAAVALRALSEHLAAESKGLLTVDEVAARMKCSARKVRDGARGGRFPFMFREGGRLVTTEAKFADWMKRRA